MVNIVWMMMKHKTEFRLPAESLAQAGYPQEN